MSEKCFCHFNGYAVKDATARKRLEDVEKKNAEIKNENAVLKARMDAMSAAPEGSTQADQELYGIRAGYDGKQYSSAGEAVREQVREICRPVFGSEIIPDFEEGSYIDLNGIIKSFAGYKRTAPISINAGSVVRIVGEGNYGLSLVSAAENAEATVYSRLHGVNSGTVSGVKEHNLVIPESGWYVISCSSGSIVKILDGGLIAKDAKEIPTAAVPLAFKKRFGVFVNRSGGLGSDSSFFTSEPVYLPGDIVIRAAGIENTGLMLVSKAANETQFENYTAVYTIPSGNAGQDIVEHSVYIAEAGWYVFSAHNYTKFEMYRSGVIFDSVKAAALGTTAPGGNTGNNAALPSYYTEYMDQRCREIQDKILSMGNNSDAFIFVTDTHFPSNAGNSGKLIGHILQHTSVDKVFMGGDIVPAYRSAYPAAETDKDALLLALKDHNAAFNPYVLPYGSLYKVKGNHDFTIKTSAESDTGYTYPSTGVRNEIMSHNNGKVITNPEDPNGCYYIVENEHQKIKYVVFDGTETTKESGNPFGNNWGVSDQQIQWVEGQLTDNVGVFDWNIVFICHEPCIKETATDGTYTHYANVENLIEKINSMQSDYIYCGAVKMFISGHDHQDLQFMKHGCWFVSVACDALYGEYAKSPVPAEFGYEYPEKTAGTVYEQTFDVVLVDFENGKVEFIRIGGGNNRIFNNPVFHVYEEQTAVIPIYGENHYVYDSTTVNQNYEMTLGNSGNRISTIERDEESGVLLNYLGIVMGGVVICQHCEAENTIVFDGFIMQ